MELKEYQAILGIIEEQEKMLVFDHCTNDDMLDLGLFLIREAKEAGIAMSVSVAKPSGTIVFQHLMRGTNGNNQRWMWRKTKTVSELEHCSLRQWARSFTTNQTAEQFGHDLKEYGYVGGAFPIILKGSEFVGIVAVSGLFHMDDHRFLTNALAKYLGVENLPQV